MAATASNSFGDEKKEALSLANIPVTDDDDYSGFLELEKSETNLNAYNQMAQTNTSGFTINQRRAFRKKLKTLKKRKRIRVAERVRRFQEWYDKGEPYILSDTYKNAVEKGLVRFFRRGYEKYWNNGEPAEEKTVVQFLRQLIYRHKLLVSGGFILKNLGLTSEERTKPSVDIDIFIPSNAPIKDPEFYETMAKIFDADRNKDDTDWVVNRFNTERSGGKSLSHFRSRNIYSVYSFERDVGMGDDVYAKMDLVRPYHGVGAMALIRNFDMSFCMNWYNGQHLYSIDPASIFKKRPGYFNSRYTKMTFGAGSVPRYRDRILKYLLRGYRLKYIDLESGKFHEFKTSDFPNAIERMNFPQRNMYYREHPNERPASVANVSATRRNNRNNQKRNNI